MDLDLVPSAQHGDEQAFASLAVGVGDRLHAVAYRILRDTDLAEDANAPARPVLIVVETGPENRSQVDALLASIQFDQ